MFSTAFGPPFQNSNARTLSVVKVYGQGEFIHDTAISYGSKGNNTEDVLPVSAWHLSQNFDIRREDQVEEGKPSATALFSAMLRAAHLLWDQPPKIFEDTLALQLSGFESEAALKAQMDQLEAEVWGTSNPDFALTARRSVTVAVVTRSHYLEDEVDQAVRRVSPST